MNLEIYTNTESGTSWETETHSMKAHVSRHTDGSYYVNAKGKDGQQVIDCIVSALRQMPENKKRDESGFLSFAVGLLFISFVTVAIVNIHFLANPIQPIPALGERGSGR